MPMSMSLAGGLSILMAAAPIAWAQPRPDLPCQCRYEGGVARQGETVCLDLNGQRRLARCEMVLNNASWRFLGIGCDAVAGLGDGQDRPEEQHAGSAEAPPSGPASVSGKTMR